MFKFLLLASAALLASPASAQLVTNPETNEIINENPNYAYAFNIADDEEQVYHGHSQSMENNVVNGEYSWVDPLGTRHVVVYRADETGFNIVDMYEEVGAVVMRARPEKKVVKAAAQPAQVIVRAHQQPAAPAPQVVVRAHQQPAAPVVDAALRKKLVRVVKRPRVSQPEPQPAAPVEVEVEEVEVEPAQQVVRLPAATQPLPVAPQPVQLAQPQPLPLPLLRFQPQPQQQAAFLPAFQHQPVQVFAAHPQVVRVAAPATAPAPAPVVRVAAAPAQAAGVTQVRFSSPTAQYDY